MRRSASLVACRARTAVATTVSANGSITDLYLRVPARAESVVVVRQMLRGLAGLFAGRPGLADCVQTAVSEAANNVVLHAYPRDVGPLEVEVSLGGPLEVRVRDRGVGLGAATPGRDQVPERFGGAVVAAMADDFEFAIPDGGGTEVRLRWTVPGLLNHGSGVVTSAVGETVLAVVPDMALRASLQGTLVAVGAGAHVDVDGLAELRRLADALLCDAPPRLSYAGLSLSLLARAGGLQISVERFVPGGAMAALQASIADGHEVFGRLSTRPLVLTDPHTGAESLVLVVP